MNLIFVEFGIVKTFWFITLGTIYAMRLSSDCTSSFIIGLFNVSIT